MGRQRIVICSQGHLFRSREVTGPAGEPVRAGCPVCGRVVDGRLVDSRVLSQEALAEAWQHSADRRR